MSNYFPGSNNDYYHILGLHPDASQSEVKKAYRKRLKDLHPDLNPHNQSLKVDDIVKAYKVLSDPEQRAWYDQIRPREGSFRFRDFLKDQGDERSWAVLIFHDLLHNHEDEAVEAYREWTPRAYRLARVLDREDYMDCAFLMAEELMKRGHDADAIPLLLDCLGLEYRRPWFRHFFPEVVETLASALLRHGLHGDLASATTWTEEVLSQPLEPRYAATFLKLGALWYIHGNHWDKAEFYMLECARIQKSRHGLHELEKALSKARGNARRN